MLTGAVGSWDDQATKPAFTAGSITALGEVTAAASPRRANGSRAFTTASICSNDRVSSGKTASWSPMANASDAGTVTCPSSGRSQLSRSPSTVCKYSVWPPVLSNKRSRTRRSSPSTPRAAARGSTSSNRNPVKATRERRSTLKSIRRRTSSRRSRSPRSVAMINTGSTESRRSINEMASTELRSAHCTSSITITSGPLD